MIATVRVKNEGPGAIDIANTGEKVQPGYMSGYVSLTGDEHLEVIAGPSVEQEAAAAAAKAAEESEAAKAAEDAEAAKAKAAEEAKAAKAKDKGAK